ncbi:MAG: hypothetical protein ACI9CE_002747 [Flavobacterium sp.]|jgi:hypothetical protein
MRVIAGGRQARNLRIALPRLRSGITALLSIQETILV